MGRVAASVEVPGPLADVEALWYDPVRWPAWVDGFGHVVEVGEAMAGGRLARALGHAAWRARARRRAGREPSAGAGQECEWRTRGSAAGAASRSPSPPATGA